MSREILNTLRSHSSEQLRTMVHEYRAELYLLRFKSSTGQLDNTHKIRALRRDIARALTILRARELMAELPTNSEKDDIIPKPTHSSEGER